MHSDQSVSQVATCCDLVQEQIGPAQMTRIRQLNKRVLTVAAGCLTHANDRSSHIIGLL